MNLTEIFKSSPERGKTNVHATYTVKKSDSVGTLRINKKGVEFLEQEKIKLEPNELLKMYFDSESLILAFKNDKKGQFRFTKSTDGGLRLSYKDLSKRLARNVEYTIQPSKEFTLLLIPVEDSEDRKQEKIPVK